jgi:hypothetical protein
MPEHRSVVVRDILTLITLMEQNPRTKCVVSDYLDSIGNFSFEEDLKNDDEKSLSKSMN